MSDFRAAAVIDAQQTVLLARVDAILADIRAKLLAGLGSGKHGLVAVSVKFGHGMLRGSEVRVIERDQPGDRVRAR